MRAIAFALLLSSSAFAEELSISERHEIELMQIKQAELDKERDEVLARIQKAHAMKSGDTWDAQGKIVRAPVVPSAPKPKPEPAKK
jgi:hypothetical protein